MPDWKLCAVSITRGGFVTKITTVGIDLAESVFSMHGIDEHGKMVLRRAVGRSKVLEAMPQPDSPP